MSTVVRGGRDQIPRPADLVAIPVIEASRESSAWVVTTASSSIAVSRSGRRATNTVAEPSRAAASMAAAIWAGCCSQAPARLRRLPRRPARATTSTRKSIAGTSRRRAGQQLRTIVEDHRRGVGRHRTVCGPGRAAREIGNRLTDRACPRRGRPLPRREAQVSGAWIAEMPDAQDCPGRQPDVVSGVLDRPAGAQSRRQRIEPRGTAQAHPVDGGAAIAAR